MMKIKFNVDDMFRQGISRLANILSFEEAEDGIPLRAVRGERVGASLLEGIGTIYYREMHHFFRELGVFVQNIREKAEFDITEDGFFKTTGVMFDCSRCAVPTVATVQKMTDYLAVMGYNLMMLYTEDTVELNSRPYFGYMRGRYSKEELRAIDDYAFDYGIEVIGCIQCYGHMGKYLIWPEAAEIKDTDNVLMAREEKTFEFLDELIGEVSSCFRSKRIHIGMDEAWDMGRGAFLDRHGYVPAEEIFGEYMNRLISIINKHGLTPMMWSDMYFDINSATGYYYDRDVIIPESTKEAIPKEVQLVFWHYGEEPQCDDEMLKKHKELGRDILFAGGLWSWSGHFPEHRYAFESMKHSLSCCRKHEVREMIATMWLDDNAECNYFANLFGLSFSAELCYNENAAKHEFKSQFETCTGGNYDAFYHMSMYHDWFGESYDNFQERFHGKAVFWQDIMEGLYDSHLLERPMSTHYQACAEEMKAYGGKWNWLYAFAVNVFEYLAVKAEIAEKLVPTYRRRDKETLCDISERLLPELQRLTKAVHHAHREMWLSNYKVFGWSNLDIRYAGVAARCETARLLIDDFLAGKTDCIQELDEPRLFKSLSGFAHYSNIATPNIKI